MAWHVLTPFAPGSAPGGVGLRAQAERQGTALALRYALRDTSGVVRRAAPADGRRRRERLWEQTCFEAFVAPATRGPYWEVNLSPAGDWNVYRFAGYREGMAVEARIAGPAAFAAVTAHDGTFEIAATVDLGAVAELSVDELHVGLATVLAAADGSSSYWALRHGSGRPDFHAREGFVLRLRRGEERT